MLILASNSLTRRKLLQEAGVSFCVASPNFDEDDAKHAEPTLPPDVLSLRLAHGKALSVSVEKPLDHVIGSDQVLECQGRIFSKPSTLEEAKQHLLALNGRNHYLHTSVALAFHNKIIWTHTDKVSMGMRQFSNAFLESYLLTEKEDILFSVGAYKFEGSGIQLFDSVCGNFHSILGLPLLPLLQELRKHGLIPS